MRHQLLMAAFLTASALVSAGSASATTVCFDAVGGACGAADPTKEKAINFDTQTQTNTDTGRTTSNDVLTFSFTADASTPNVDLNFGNGQSTIKDHGNGIFKNLTISAAGGFGFEDLIFNVKPNTTGHGNDKHDDITLTAYDAGGQVGGTITINDFATSGVGNQDFKILATGGLLTSVMLSSTIGFSELKQFEVSGYASLGNGGGGGVGGVPEASTWAMMMIGFAGLGFAGYRSRRKADAVA